MGRRNVSILLFLLELFDGNFLVLLTEEVSLKSNPGFNSTSRPQPNVGISIRIKSKGHLVKNGLVPFESRATMSCKVKLKKGTPKDVFQLMMVGFILPDGRQLVAKHCVVALNDTIKRCNMVFKRVTFRHQGKYQCFAYYRIHGKAAKNFKDAYLVSGKTCPPSMKYCNITRKCILSIQDCNRSRKCTPKDFRCSDGQCIERQYLCDDIPDCDDGSDETICESLLSNCNKTETFICNNGKHVSLDTRCNGIDDCQDNSDEENCTGTCQKGYVNCPGGNNCSSIPRDKRLKSVPNAHQETFDSKSGCSTGKCIKREQICNGVPDCNDGSDEIHCNEVLPSRNTTETSNTYKVDPVINYAVPVSGMFLMAVLIIIFIIWVKRKRTILERKYSVATEIHIHPYVV